MPSILEKCKTLLDTDLHKIVDQVLETKSTKSLDAFIVQVENNLDELEETCRQVSDSVRILKKRHEDFSKLADEIDKLNLQRKNELNLRASIFPEYIKREIAREYYTAWIDQDEQYSDMLWIQVNLEDRLTTTKQKHEKVQSLLNLAKPEQIKKLGLGFSSGNENIDIVIDSIHSQINQGYAISDDRYRPTIIDKQGVGRVERQLEERRHRLLGKDSDDK